MFGKHPKPNRQVVSVDVLTGYARWAKDYPAYAHNLLMKLEERAMLSLLPDPMGKICLDLACGSGRYMRHLQTRQAGQVFGLDYSAHMLSRAKGIHPSFQITRCPFVTLPFASETIDLITCGMAVGHEKELNRLLLEAARLLRAGGTLLYSDFHPFLALAGGRRTFTANDTIFDLEHYVHLYHHHQQACRAAGLIIDAVLEPSAREPVSLAFENNPVKMILKRLNLARFGSPESAVLSRIGQFARNKSFREPSDLRNNPVVLVIRAVKPK